MKNGLYNNAAFPKNQFANKTQDCEGKASGEIVNCGIVVLDKLEDCDCSYANTSTGRRVVHSKGCFLAVQRRNNEFKVFDDISEKMWACGWFRKAFDEWDMDPATLHTEVSRLNIDRVREEIKETAPKSGIRNKGAYLRTRLRNVR